MTPPVTGLSPSGWVASRFRSWTASPTWTVTLRWSSMPRRRTLPWPEGTVRGRSIRWPGWQLRLDTGETAIDVAVGHREWRKRALLGRPVVATGAWQDGVYVADLYVITGPHRVRLVVDGGRAVATWNEVPLVGPDLLRQLRSPLMTRPDVS